MEILRDEKEQNKSETSPMRVFTVLIQRKIVLSIAELFGTTSNEYIIISKEIMETGDLWRKQKCWVSV